MRKPLIPSLCFFFGLFAANGQCWSVLDSGDNHTVAIHQDGTLWAWGSNSQGEVGDGTINHKSVPTLISSATNWIAISAGNMHSVALKADGSLWSWGYDVYGALGLGATTQINVPTRIGTDTDWKWISAGSSTSFAVKADGTLWGWGVNVHGEIGDGTITPKVVPTRIGTANNWKKVFAGNHFTAGIKTNGTLWTWGLSNHWGQLGNGTYNEHLIPTQIGTDTNWESVSTEMTFGVALKTNGTIWGWGDNNEDQLGLGTHTLYLSPTQIGTDTNWKAAEAGKSKSFFIKTNGTLWGTGRPFLGNGTSASSATLVQIGTDTDWKTVSSDLFQTIALKTNNLGYGWGSNYFGQLGNGYFNTGIHVDPTNYTLPGRIICPCTSSVTPSFTITQRICTGSTAPVLPMTSSNGVSGSWTPSVIDNNTSATYTFTPNPTLFPCAQPVLLQITVVPVQSPTFNPIPLSICQYETAPVLPGSSTNIVPITGVWTPSSINTDVIGPTTYTFVPNADQCVAAGSYQLTVTITPSITSDFGPINPICVGEAAPVLATVAPNGVTGTWSPAVIDNTISGDYEFTPDGIGCIATQVLHVEVLSLTVPDFPDLLICNGDTSVQLGSTSPNGITGSWMPAVVDVSVGGIHLFTPDPFQCASTQTILVTTQQSTLQNVSYVVSDAFAENATVSVITTPVGNYLYQLDGGAFQSSSVFQNVSPGLHTVNVKDVDGCNAITTVEGIRVIDYPKYFTPNGDGYQDFWNIRGAQDVQNWKLYIYDRYGKLLKQLSPSSQGWNGTYNGALLPSTDYWFKIEYYEKMEWKQFVSHFALKR